MILSHFPAPFSTSLSTVPSPSLTLHMFPHPFCLPPYQPHHLPPRDSDQKSADTAAQASTGTLPSVCHGWTPAHRGTSLTRGSSQQIQWSLSHTRTSTSRRTVSWSVRRVVKGLLGGDLAMRGGRLGWKDSNDVVRTRDACKRAIAAGSQQVCWCTGLRLQQCIPPAPLAAVVLHGMLAFQTRESLEYYPM